MNKYNVLCILFALAACCFAAGAAHHILNTRENILLPILLAVGCFFASFGFYKKK